MIFMPCCLHPRAPLLIQHSDTPDRSPHQNCLAVSHGIHPPHPPTLAPSSGTTAPNQLHGPAVQLCLSERTVGCSSSLWLRGVLWMLLWAPKPWGRAPCRAPSCAPIQVQGDAALLSVHQHLNSVLSEDRSSGFLTFLRRAQMYLQAGIHFF